MAEIAVGLMIQKYVHALLDGLGPTVVHNSTYVIVIHALLMQHAPKAVIQMLNVLMKQDKSTAVCAYQASQAIHVLRQ